MKKLASFALATILVFALVACGRRDDTADQTPMDDATNPTTDIVPDIADDGINTPEDDTNIPDPSVNDNSTNNDTGIVDGTEEMIPEADQNDDSDAR